MAQAIDFPERNDFIGKPQDMSNNQCYALPICRILTLIPGVIERAPPVKSHSHISFWELSKEEIDEIIKNHGVYVKIIGTTLFPMSVHGIKPIYDHDYVFTKEEVELMKPYLEK